MHTIAAIFNGCNYLNTSEPLGWHVIRLIQFETLAQIQVVSRGQLRERDFKEYLQENPSQLE